MSKKQEEHEMVVAGLVVDPVSNSPIVVLKQPEGEICLPIWIGMSEATSIATSLKNIEVPRPMTHDLLKTTVDLLGGKVIRIVIVSLHENTFYSTIEIKVGDECRELDSRPSDAIALAIRFGVPIYVNEDVLDKAKAVLVPVDENGNQLESEQISPDSLGFEDSNTIEHDIVLDDNQENNNNEVYTIQHYRNLDDDELSRLLEDMNPDDFKYKM